jgi:hypothetical protein
VSDTLAAVLKTDPDLTQFPAQEQKLHLSWFVDRGVGHQNLPSTTASPRASVLGATLSQRPVGRCSPSQQGSFLTSSRSKARVHFGIVVLHFATFLGEVALATQRLDERQDELRLLVVAHDALIALRNLWVSEGTETDLYASSRLGERWPSSLWRTNLHPSRHLFGCRTMNNDSISAASVVFGFRAHRPMYW